MPVTPGAEIVRGPFGPYDFNTPSLNAGVAVYTPTVDDILIDAWIEVVTAFNGTTPKADIGPSGGPGLFKSTQAAAAIDLTAADVVTVPGIRWGNRTGFKNFGLLATSQEQERDAPAHITAANPLLVWASQTGLIGGTAVGGTAGQFYVYLITATPTLL